jgi:hypothetical protein
MLFIKTKMINIVLKEDFVGRWNVSMNKFGEEDFEDYIQSYSNEILLDLLGRELFDLFIADLTTDPSGHQVPTTQIYIDIFEAIDISSNDLCCKDKQQSWGMVDMLKCMIRFYWLRDMKYKQTISGTSVMDSENSVVIKSLHYGLTKQYNRGVESYQTIQCYIEKNSTDYPTFDGTIREITSWL